MVVQAAGQGSKNTYAIFRFESEPISWTSVIQLLEHEGEFMFLHIGITPHAYMGKGPDRYEELGDRYLEDGETVTGYLMLLRAVALCNLGSAIETGCQMRIRQRLRELSAGRFGDYWKNLKIGDESYTFINIKTMGALDFTPRLEYVSKVNPAEAEVRAEARSILDAILVDNPSLLEEYGGLGFTAYDRAPTKTTQPLNSITVVLQDPAEDSDQN